MSCTLLSGVVKKEVSRVMCFYENCNKTFTKNSNLHKHLKLAHGIVREKENSALECKDCSQKFNLVEQFRKHLEMEHGIQMSTRKLSFNSLQDFEEWKEQEEKRTTSQYRKESGKKKLANGSVRTYYRCHRSGKFVSTGKGKHFTKTQGSCKAGVFCPADLMVTVSVDSTVEVLFHETHHGHGQDLGHLHLSRKEREAIAEKLKNGESFNAILESVRQEKHFYDRLFLLTRKDLHNIRRYFGITKVNDSDITSSSSGCSGESQALPIPTVHNSYDPLPGSELKYQDSVDQSQESSEKMQVQMLTNPGLSEVPHDAPIMHHGSSAITSIHNNQQSGQIQEIHYQSSGEELYSNQLVGLHYQTVEEVISHHDLNMGGPETHLQYQPESLHQLVPVQPALDQPRHETPFHGLHSYKLEEPVPQHLTYSEPTAPPIHLLQTPPKPISSDTGDLDAWVSAVRLSRDKDCVIYYKNQGEIEPSNLLGVNDFMLVIMTDAQRELLVERGPVLICVDSILGRSSQDLSLTTLMTIDEYDEGFPLAFCITNKIDLSSMIMYFRSIRLSAGQISTEAFMTKDCATYWKAWAQEMGPPNRKLLCSWQVDHDWRHNLQTVKTKVKQVEIYKSLCTLLEDPAEETFQNRLSDFLEGLKQDHETSEFYLYFVSFYSNRCEEWAYCHRKSSLISKKASLEATHRILKKVYLESKGVKSLTKCINFLLQLVKDKVHDRTMKYLKGKLSRAIFNIRAKHKDSLTICSADISCLPGLEWLVTCQVSSQKYLVKKIVGNCIDCKLFCSSCNNICVHEFSCTCADSAFHYNMCEHVHAVITHAYSPQTNTDPGVSNSVISSTSKPCMITNLCQQVITLWTSSDHKDQLEELVTNKLREVVQLLDSKQLGLLSSEAKARKRKRKSNDEASPGVKYGRRLKRDMTKDSKLEDVAPNLVSSPSGES